MTLEQARSRVRERERHTHTAERERSRKTTTTVYYYDEKRKMKPGKMYISKRSSLVLFITITATALLTLFLFVDARSGRNANSQLQRDQDLDEFQLISKQLLENDIEAAGIDPFVTHEDMVAWVEGLRRGTCPEISNSYSIGKSVEGEELYVVQLTGSLFRGIDNIDKDVPKFRFLANMHGDETVTRHIALSLFEYLCSNYEKNWFVRKLLDNVDIHIGPNMNPDAYMKSLTSGKDCSGVRENINGVDLNRNFPDFWSGDVDSISSEQPETVAIMEWTASHQFTLTGNMHSGALVMSYPYDGTPKGNFRAPPDEKTFIWISKLYSLNHPEMRNKITCGTDSFQDGITQGWEWYPLSGGAQDYNYLYHGNLEVTMELACCKKINKNELHKYWQDNKYSLLNFLASVHVGIHGFVVDEEGNPIEGAEIIVEDSNGNPVAGKMYTNKNGAYFRVLPPNTKDTPYTITVSKEGKVRQKRLDILVEKRLLSPTRVHFCMKPVSNPNVPCVVPRHVSDTPIMEHLFSEVLSTQANLSLLVALLLFIIWLVRKCNPKEPPFEK